MEQMSLRHFVGMKFKTERVEAYFCQTILYNLQGSHLFCNEENTLAVVQSVGNHVGDGLTFSCSRRTIEDETVS